MTKRAFGVIISYDNIVGKWLLDFLAGITVLSLVAGYLIYILVIVLLQELTMFPYRLQVYCTSKGFIMISPPIKVTLKSAFSEFMFLVLSSNDLFGL